MYVITERELTARIILDSAGGNCTESAKLNSVSVLFIYLGSNVILNMTEKMLQQGYKPNVLDGAEFKNKLMGVMVCF
jgi:hypothetical protein